MRITNAEQALLNNTYKIIGQNIHKIRMERKCSLKKLSKMTGLNPITIDYYEMGRVQIHMKELLRISLALKVKLDNLLK